MYDSNHGNKTQDTHPVSHCVVSGNRTVQIHKFWPYGFDLSDTSRTTGSGYKGNANLTRYKDNANLTRYKDNANLTLSL